MLHILQGRAGGGKSTNVFERITGLVAQGHSVVLFVPEQFTFEMERKYYNQCGARVFSKLKVTSFTRYAHELFKTYGGNSGNYANDSIKLLMMNLAVHEVEDLLGFYQKSANHFSFSEQMISMVTELKHAGMDVETFSHLILGLPDGRLKEKLSDIHTIYQHYDARLTERFIDALDDLQRAAALLHTHKPLTGSAVFFDEYKGFTAPEQTFLQSVMAQCDDVTVTLCTDGKTDLFQSVEKTKQELIQTARKAGAKIAVPETLLETHRFRDDALCFLEQHILQDSRTRYQGNGSGVSGMLAANEYEEVDYVAATIHRLVEEGYRFCDIVVVGRDLQTYLSPLMSAMEKYEIPYYTDQVKTLADMPIYRLVQHGLQAVLQGNIHGVLSMLKCGLTPFSMDEIGKLENYFFYWDIGYKDLKAPFTLSPFGVNGARSEHEKKEEVVLLSQLNRIRQTLDTALKNLERSIGTKSVSKMAAGVLDFLENLGVRQVINQLLNGVDLADAEALEQAGVHKRAFEAVGTACDLIFTTLQQHKTSGDHFWEYMNVVAQSLELGSIPQTADCVLIGSVERIRTDAPKVVVVLGVNDKVFPYLPSEEGLLQDREKEQFASLCQLPLSKSMKERVQEEQFIAYKIMTLPSERLILTARKADLKGTAIAPSALLSQLKRLYGEEIVSETLELSPFYFCRTKQSAFAKMANLFQEDSALSATLKEYFSTAPDYKAMMDGLAHLALSEKQTLQQLDQVKALFGTTAVLSPSRVESYHRCKFRYFCEYGLGLRRREKLQLNASNRGNIVHEVLSMVCSQIDDYQVFDEDQIKGMIAEAVTEYLDKMGGSDRQSARFLHLYETLEHSVLTLMKRLFAELGSSAFQPIDFEYQIGKEGNTPGYRLAQGEVTIYVHGVVDRIDKATDRYGNPLIRVVDYKTGTKEFKLADIYHGLNLQMLLYLLCLKEQGVGAYEGVSAAGALYMPAGAPSGTLGRYATEQDVIALQGKHYRMKGVIVERKDVLLAMEPELLGEYTPVVVKASAYNKDHALKDDVFDGDQANQSQFYAASLESMVSDSELQLLFTHIEALLAKMVQELYSGDIEAKPLQDACRYCDFSLVCGYDETKPPKEYENLKKSELLQRMRKEERDGEDELHTDTASGD